MKLLKIMHLKKLLENEAQINHGNRKNFKKTMQQ